MKKMMNMIVTIEVISNYVGNDVRVLGRCRDYIYNDENFNNGDS